MPRQTPVPPAPAERCAAADLKRQAGYFAEGHITRHLLDAVPTLLVVLNRHRQIVFANRALLETLGAQVAPVGQRPGEALGCVHAETEESGCGTAEPCGGCGMLVAILAGLAGRAVEREARFARRHGDGVAAMDLLVRATPLSFGEECFTVFAVSDVSHEKRRRALERLFFHDVLNLMGSIRGFAELLRDYELENRREIFDLIHAAAEQTIEEIEAQRLLSAAESRELTVRPEPVRVRELLGRLVGIYRQHAAAVGRTLVLASPVPEATLVSDRTLLARVLGNMIKNALEACAPGETVTVGARQEEGRTEFFVHNPAAIPPEAQSQIFQRSFSTKGPGRGLGTYSMRLLSEFLRGEVTFSSSPPHGTTFRASYPSLLP